MKYSEIWVKFQRILKIQKFSVNVVHILKKCKCKKDLGTFRKIRKIKMRKFLKKFGSKFRVTSEKI